jgi:mono/diheme cytochrome c family protein
MWKKLSALVALLLVAVVGGGLAYLFLKKPQSTPPRAGKFAATPERLARGRYLFNAVCDCNGCHSQRDFSRFGGPVTAHGTGVGHVFEEDFGLPGTIVAPNITPDPDTGIGRWTDGEKLRAIREGVDREGRALFPMMPYQAFAKLSDADAEALVAYLDTLEPVRVARPRSAVSFPVSLLMKSAPRPVGTVAEPDRAGRVKYGAYLVNAADCSGCHTPHEKGEPLAGLDFAGGEEFKASPKLVVVSANITPDPETGIGKWSEEFFVGRFARHRDYAGAQPPTVGPDAFTLMPWLGLSQMTDDDLKAVYAYLRTLKPVSHKVETHPLHPKAAAFPAL